MRSVPDVAFVISNSIARQHASEPILKTVFENSAEANDCGMAAVRSSFPADATLSGLLILNQSKPRVALARNPGLSD
jgi:hypothetical protein